MITYRVSKYRAVQVQPFNAAKNAAKDNPGVLPLSVPKVTPTTPPSPSAGSVDIDAAVTSALRKLSGDSNAPSAVVISPASPSPFNWKMLAAGAILSFLVWRFRKQLP